MNDVKYRTLFETLKKDILGGRYNAQNPFPSIRALIRKHGVSKTTVQRTLDELVHQDLISRKQGRGTFVTGKIGSRLIGLVIPGIGYSSEFFQPIIAELVRRAKSRDYTIVMEGCWSPSSTDNGREAIAVAERLISQRVDGVIYQPLEYSENSESINRRVLSAFSRVGIPVVLLDGDIVSGPNRSDYDLVTINNVSAGEVLARHMVDRRARNIRFLMRANWVENVKNRVRGVRNEILAQNLSWSSKSISLTDPSDLPNVSKMMKSKPRPDAIICENDVIAAALMKTLSEIGFRVPEDVLVAGFDDVRIAQLSSPGITTIHQPCEGLAQVAFDRLLSRISDPSLVTVQINLSFKLVERGSTGRLKRRAATRRSLAHESK